MASAQLCPICGSALAPSAGGLCAKCILEDMLNPAPSEDISSAPPTGGGPSQSRSSFPRWFGAYELLGEIARGGMGVVFRARQPQLKRSVALKVILTGELASPEFVQRFRTEAEAVASLDHPNIVPIYEIGEYAQQPFFSMKLIEGFTLAEKISTFGSPAGSRAAAALIAKLAHAVHYAHQHGILHRDLKPNNILLDKTEEPHLTDFGLAKLMEQGSAITKTKAILGTPSYMAPEQARGDTKHLTTAADVYGLGAILYEMLTGQPPFAGGTTMATIRKVMEQEPRRPSALNRHIGRDLETICMKCLEKEPLRRYGSAEALAEDLGRWLRREPVQARPASTVERVVKWASRKPATAALLAGIIISLAAGFGLASWQSVARQVALVQSRRALYAAQVGLVLEAWSDGHVARAHALLETLKPSAGVEDLRGFEWRYLWRLCQDQSYYTLSEEQIPVQSVAVSPDGGLVALAGGFRFVSLWDVASRHVLARLQGGKGNRTVAFSPDGESVAAAGYDGDIRVWNVTTHQLTFTLSGHLHTVERIAFSPDGKWLASASRPDGIVKLWNLTNHLPVGSFGGLPNDRPAIAFSADSKLLAWTAGDHSIRLSELDTGQESAKLSGHSGLVVYLAFSKDRRWLASAGADGLARIWDMTTRQEAAILSGHKSWVTSVDFSPDSQLLSTTCVDGTIKLWNVQTGAEITTFKGHEMWVNNAVFLPDGRTLVSGGDDRKMKLWEVVRRPRSDTIEVDQTQNAPEPLVTATVDESLEPNQLREEVGAIMFAADSSRLITVDNRPAVGVWDGQGRQVKRTFALADPIAFTTGFFPDGQHLATAGRDGKVRLWAIDPPAQYGVLTGAPTALTTLAISSDGQRLAGSGRIGTLWLWDLPSQKLLRRFFYGSGQLTTLAFCPDGRAVVAALRGRSVPDQLLQMSLDSGNIQFFPRHHQEWVTAIAFSADAKILASCSRDGTTALWQASTRSLIATLRGHSGYVTDVAFSPDDLTLATASNDGTVKLWSLRSQLELLTLPGHIPPGTRLAFSRDGAALAACGEDGVLHIWRADVLAK